VSRIPSTVDEHWMSQAIALAESVLYLTAPNPRVACLIVRDGQLLAQGVTQAVGGPHAETMALRHAKQTGVNVKGATVYVTLEPCSHHGRTPPCVDALLAAQPARVVVAMYDPNPLVGGNGVAKLRAAGIEVLTGVCLQQALALNPGFVARMTRKTPWVWAKVASSLDGQIALQNGRSKWITGDQARSDGHHWRARSCVVLTGSGTILADDPQMNVRDVATERQPIKAVIDTDLRIPVTARLLDGGKVWIFTCNDDPARAAALAERNAEVVVLPKQKNHVDLHALMHWLGEHAINEVHVEAGSRLTGALLQARCVDEMLMYTAPLIIGQGIGMAHMDALANLSEAQRFEFLDIQRCGSDLRVRARCEDRWNELVDVVSKRLS
jgi:diaminohydroxyphosphoribosylaminopyrimidine deaminase/5-amino-6-(5-phosphoribosylamino)uracil reductase